MDDNTKFEAWMKSVDSYLSGGLGVGVDDLPDFAYRDHFDFGFSPRFVAMCIRNEQGA
jgi:hypothetical protein